jgi:hypothetical protein
MHVGLAQTSDSFEVVSKAGGEGAVILSSTPGIITVVEYHVIVRHRPSITQNSYSPLQPTTNSGIAHDTACQP